MQFGCSEQPHLAFRLSDSHKCVATWQVSYTRRICRKSHGCCVGINDWYPIIHRSLVGISGCLVPGGHGRWSQRPPWPCMSSCHSMLQYSVSHWSLSWHSAPSCSLPAHCPLMSYIEAFWQTRLEQHWASRWHIWPSLMHVTQTPGYRHRPHYSSLHTGVLCAYKVSPRDYSGH